jgi:hypothetical protein
VKVKGKKNSAKLNDMTIDLIVESEIGKFKRSHNLTIVTVEIDPVISGETPTNTSDINFIRNPAVTPILLGSAASATTAPKIEITKITPDLTFTDDDDRIAWLIVGGETPAAGKAKYEGRADFLSDEASKRGKKIQIAGGAIGDVLVQPYSGGFGYGMFRTHVNKLRQIKFRVNRVFTKTVAAVLPSPGKPGKPGRTGHVPSRSHADAGRHIQIVNIYLRQVGIQLVEDDSTEVASKTGNNNVGVAAIDPHVVAVTRVSAGHFDVEVDLNSMVFRAADFGNTAADGAIRVNTRNEIISFAYIESLASGNNVLASANMNPTVHVAGLVLKDKGVPSSSLIRKSGIPPDTPVGEVKMTVSGPFRVKTVATTPANRNTDLEWGIVVPTASIDTFATQVAGGGVTQDMVYAATLSHEVGHILGLLHRIAGGTNFPDGISTPQQKNIMFPSANPPTMENFDIVQAKTIRLSDVLTRTE